MLYGVIWWLSESVKKRKIRDKNVFFRCCMKLKKLGKNDICWCKI